MLKFYLEIFGLPPTTSEMDTSFEIKTIHLLSNGYKFTNLNLGNNCTENSMKRIKNKYFLLFLHLICQIILINVNFI